MNDPHILYNIAAQSASRDVHRKLRRVSKAYYTLLQHDRPVGSYTFLPLKEPSIEVIDVVAHEDSQFVTESFRVQSASLLRNCSAFELKILQQHRHIDITSMREYKPNLRYGNIVYWPSTERVNQVRFVSEGGRREAVFHASGYLSLRPSRIHTDFCVASLYIALQPLKGNTSYCIYCYNCTTNRVVYDEDRGRYVANPPVNSFDDECEPGLELSCTRYGFIEHPGYNIEKQQLKRAVLAMFLRVDCELFTALFSRAHLADLDLI